jgi:hypothetical protein
MIVYLVPLGAARFELYSEPPADPGAPPQPSAGVFRRWAHATYVRWHALAESARRSTATNRLARWRDGFVRRMAEAIAEQRTLWTLAQREAATLLYPSSIEAAAARGALVRALSRARRRHAIWLAVDAPLFLVSGILAPIPGPNLLAYFFGVRVVMHWFSWRGAGHAARIDWTLEPDASLAELGSLVDLPRAARAPRVAEIAARLNLHRLSAFFERVAV